MRFFKTLGIIFVVFTICLSVMTASFAQEYKKGDDVIALRDAPLKIETKMVGTVRKGDKLTVEDVQGNWLGVRSGDMHGWIEGTSVINAALKTWYERQSDMTSIWAALMDSKKRVDESGLARSIVFGVMFDFHSVKPGAEPSTSGQVGAYNYMNDVRVPSHFSVDYGEIKVTLAKLSVEANERKCYLSINGKSYKTVEQGDYVLITKSREVFVNGELRKGK